MGLMYGADAEELEQIASELEGYEKELGQLLLEGVGAVSMVGLSATLNTIWRGPRASDFAGIWEARHLTRIRDVQSVLTEAANDLRNNAADQRRTSEGLGTIRTGISKDTIPGGGTPRDETDVEGLEWIENVADAIGIGDDVLDGVIAGLRATDPAALKALEGFLGDIPFLNELAGMAKFAGDVAGAFLAFANDFVDQYSAGLPLDEVIVHASIEMALHVGLEVGIDKISIKLGAMVGAAFAGIGAPVGAGVGWVVGQLANIAAHEVIDHFDGLERIADIGVDAYRLANQGVEFLIDGAGQIVDLGGEVIGAIGDAGELILDSTIDLGGRAIDGLVDGAENVWDFGGDAVNYIGGIL